MCVKKKTGATKIKSEAIVLCDKRKTRVAKRQKEYKVIKNVKAIVRRRECYNFLCILACARSFMYLGRSSSETEKRTNLVVVDLMQSWMKKSA